MAKEPTHKGSIVIEQGEGDIYTRAHELIDKLSAASKLDPEHAGGFILIFDEPEREAVGMVTNLPQEPALLVMEAMAKSIKTAVN